MIPRLILSKKRLTVGQAFKYIMARIFRMQGRVGTIRCE